MCLSGYTDHFSMLTLVVRRETPALRYGAYQTYKAPTGIFAYLRGSENFTQEAKTLSVPKGEVLLSTHLDRYGWVEGVLESQRRPHNKAMTRVLFVCMGNICRSPMAEGILRRKLRERGLEGRFEVDSCGTGGWHEGQPADPRAQAVLARHNALFPHTARQIRAEDLDYFDHIFVMDRENLHTLERRFPAHKGKARLLLELNGGGEVPDPYYGGPQDFEAVYRLLEEALEAFLQTLQTA